MKEVRNLVVAWYKTCGFYDSVIVRYTDMNGKEHVFDDVPWTVAYLTVYTEDCEIFQDKGLYNYYYGVHFLPDDDEVTKCLWRDGYEKAVKASSYIVEGDDMIPFLKGTSLENIIPSERYYIHKGRKIKLNL